MTGAPAFSFPLSLFFPFLVVLSSLSWPSLSSPFQFSFSPFYSFPSFLFLFFSSLFLPLAFFPSLLSVACFCRSICLLSRFHCYFLRLSRQNRDQLVHIKSQSVL